MVDILMAVYNGEKYLKEQLMSIEKQTYKQWRLIIRDDGSNDRSMEIAEEFAKRFTSGKVIIYRNETPTGAASRNFMKLVHDSKADYTMFADQDDYWLENKIYLTMRAMRKAQKVWGEDKPVLVHSDLLVVDSHRNVLAESFFDYQKLPKTTALSQLMIQNSVTGCTVMINKALRNYLVRAKDAEQIVMHDYFAALIAQAFGHIVFVKQPLIQYRQHGNNSVGAMKATGFRYLMGRAFAGRRQFRERMLATMKQIEYFNELYSDELKNEDQKAMLSAYAQLFKCRKLERIYFYMKYRALKYGTLRKIMQIVWS